MSLSYMTYVRLNGDHIGSLIGFMSSSTTAVFLDASLPPSISGLVTLESPPCCFLLHMMFTYDDDDNDRQIAGGVGRVQAAYRDDFLHNPAQIDGTKPDPPRKAGPNKFSATTR
jgi:hypothetical protein